MYPALRLDFTATHFASAKPLATPGIKLLEPFRIRQRKLVTAIVVAHFEIKI